MGQEELALYETFSGCGTDTLFWSMMYLNNAVFQTPFEPNAQKMLMNSGQGYASAISRLYPSQAGRELINALSNNNQWFITYMSCLLGDSGQLGFVRDKWMDNGRKIAGLFNQVNPFWRQAEWSAMLNHQAELLARIAASMKEKDYAGVTGLTPLCRQLVQDMSKYMCSGIEQQRASQPQL